MNKKLMTIGLVGLGVYALLSTKKSKISGLGVTSSFVARAALNEVMGTLKRVARDLTGPINQASSLTGTPAWLILAISAHEIRFAPYTFVHKGVNATGPMQLTAPTVFDMYYFALKWNLVTPGLEQYMRSTLGSQYDSFIKLAKNRQSKPFIQPYLLDPQFNLTMGALLLRCLMYMFSPNGVLDQAKLALAYNKGIGYATKHMSSPAYLRLSDQAVLASAPGGVKGEAYAYVRDMVGIGGWFDNVHSV